MLNRWTALFTASFGLLLSLAGKSLAEPLQFVVLGDIPYGEHQIVRLMAIGSEIRKNGFPFVIHYGDVKAGSSRCDDALLLERKRAIYGLIPGRVFFTPGDNDWTDCDRRSAGGFDELERLEVLRKIFFCRPDRNGGSRARVPPTPRTHAGSTVACSS